MRSSDVSRAFSSTEELIVSTVLIRLNITDAVGVNRHCEGFFAHRVFAKISSHVVRLSMRSMLPGRADVSVLLFYCFEEQCPLRGQEQKAKRLKETLIPCSSQQ